MAAAARAAAAEGVAACGVDVGNGDKTDLDYGVLLERFRRAVAGDDGTIDRGKLHKFFRDEGAIFSEEELDLMLAAADVGGRGSVHYKDFCDWVTADARGVREGAAGPEGRSSGAAAGSARSRVGAPGRETSSPPPPGAGTKALLPPDAKYTSWSKFVAVPQRYCRSPCAIHDTAERGISLEQLESVGAFVEEVVENEDVVGERLIEVAKDGEPVTETWLAVNLYTICNFFVKPLTSGWKCSFVELIADACQIPKWFVSHWWGTHFRESLKMLRLHWERRGLAADAFYWICTFANNQHDLGELGGGLLGTPFVRVLRSDACEGTVALMDSGATPFKRLWCVLECFESLDVVQQASKAGHLYDLAAWISEGAELMLRTTVRAQAALQLDRGGGTWRVETELEDGVFPLTVAERGVDVDVNSATASMDRDKDMIMTHIADEADELNRVVGGRFAPSAIYSAARTGDLARLQSLLARFPGSINSANRKGLTPTYVATSYGQLNTLKALLEAQADLHKASNTGATPIFVAAQDGRVPELKALLEARADADQAIGRSGFTPAMKAAQNGHAGVLRTLLGARVDADKSNGNGSTPLFMAAQRGRIDALKVLLETRADLDKAGPGGTTPLSVAALKGNVEAVRALLEARAGTDKFDDDGETTALTAAKEGHASVLRVLLGARVDTNAAGKSGETPLAAADRQGHAEASELLRAATSGTL